MIGRSVAATAAYVARVCARISVADEAVMRQLTPVCGDCGAEAADVDSRHVVINAWVLVGCEGGRQVNLDPA